MGNKRKWVPKVLWRVYDDRASCLSDTILSLIPQFCDCNYSGKCMRCVFGNGDENTMMSYLVRPNDPTDYQLLMNTCFVVVPIHAPPLPPLLPFSRRWSMLQIIDRTIETILRKQAATSNVLCSSHSKSKGSSSIVKLLTCSAWDLTLKRIGDSLMDYLLTHTLIFICIRPNVHQQVAGPPVNENGLFAKFPICIPGSESSTQTRHQRKKRRVDRNDKTCEDPPSNVSLGAGQQKSFDCENSRNEGLVGGSANMSNLLHVNEAANLSNLGLHSKNVKVKPGKRVRLPSWQRRKRRKLLLVQGNHIQESSTKVLHETHHHGLSCSMSEADMMPTSAKHLENHDGAHLESKQTVPQLCQCCSIFQLLSPVPVDASINRKSMFYCMEHSSSLFLKNHLLNSSKPGFTGANGLFEQILGLSSIDTLSCSRGHCSHGHACLYHSLGKLFNDLQRRARRCRHRKLLKKHCSFHLVSQISDQDAGSVPQAVNQEVKNPLKWSVHTELRNCKRTSEVTQHHFGLNRPYCLKDEVVSFVWAVCRSIVPPDLLGVPSASRILRRNISRFIKLRRFEKFSLKQCVHKLNMSKFPLLLNEQSLKCFTASAIKNESEGSSVPMHQHLQNFGHCALKQIVLDRWIFWLFTNIVVPLVRAHFYVTESEHGKQNIYYYRKSVWKKLSNDVSKQLKERNYRCLNYASVNSILRKRSFGFSKVRLCPKKMGARPLANLKVSSRVQSRGSRSHACPQRKRKRGQSNKTRKFSYFKAVNTVLRNAHVILKDMRIREPEMWGSSVSSYNDIYRKLCPFLRNLKEGKGALPTVYIVVSDVQKAFDTVRQDKLLSILNEIQMADKYTLQQFSQIFCRKRFLWVSKGLKLARGIYDTGLAENASGCRKSCHVIIVNQEHNITVMRENLSFILHEHLTKNMLKLGRHFFLQIVGIPQGSVLSSLLCSLYYGHLERNVIFPHLAKGANDVLSTKDTDAAALENAQSGPSSSAEYLLLRLVDDFLLLSTSKNQASSFFSRFQRGFREYNCYMNQDKFCTNFDSGLMAGLNSKRRLVGGDGSSFICWSGLLINCSSLEIQADYTRYLNDHLRSSLTLNLQTRPGHGLKAKLCAYMRPKCHPIFFDSTINSRATIRLNVFQAFVLCAMKFHCYVRELSTWCKLRPKSCLKSIEGSLRYMYRLMKRRMYGISGGSNHHPVLTVGKKEVLWLGFTAYIRVLNRKQSRYKKLLHLLRAKIIEQFPTIGGSHALKYAVDDSHSTFLWKIKY